MLDDHKNGDSGAQARRHLVVLGRRGLHGLKALGSVSERVAHQAKCSVLVVREAPWQRAEQAEMSQASDIDDPRRRDRRRHPPRREHASPACARRPDRQALVRFFEQLSDRSLYLRFHGRPTIDERLVNPVLDPDWVDRGALMGSVVESGEERVVALANYVRLRDPLTAEVAFAVTDAYQGRGIGTRLVEQLAARAAAHGIERFIGEVMADNAAMIKVFEGVGFEVTRTLGGGEVEMTFPIAPTVGYASLVEERDHTAVVASLRPFFEAQSVAVLGASSRRGTIGGELFRNILQGEYVGAAYPVNRNGESVAGVRGYSTIGDIPDPIDLAVVCLPASAVLESVESVLDAGVRAVCVISAGFAEVGSEGEERQRSLLASIRAHGARLLGSQLPRHLVRSGPAQCDVRLARGAARKHRFLLPERRTWTRVARSNRVTRPRLVRVRLDREQG